MYTATLSPVSNAETWTDTLEFFDDEDGEPFFLAASPPDEITLKLRNPVSGEEVLSGSLSGGELIVVDDGVVEFTFEVGSMDDIEPRTYELGVLYEDDDVTKQVILGKLPVLEGL